MDTPPLSRRDWLARSSALLALAALGASRRGAAAVLPEALVPNPRGGYRFLPGVPFLSFGALAADGYEIVRTTFRQPRPFPAGMADVERLLRAVGRPMHA